MPVAINARVRQKDAAGIRRRVVMDLTGPSSYANPGGETITAASLGLASIESVQVPQVASDANGANIRLITIVIATDGSSFTVRWYTDLTTEVVNAVNLSAYSVRIEIAGK